MKKLLLASIAVSALVLWAVSCGGGGGGGTPTGPTANPPATPPPTPPATPPTNSPPQASATVNIVSSSGSRAFSPNPVEVPAGGTIQWRNSTTDRHVLVMNDGSPIGTLAAGATLTTTVGAGGNFRCVTHPSMVGSINGASAPKPPDDDPYDYVARSVTEPQK